jgi:hypothetical protein
LLWHGFCLLLLLLLGKGRPPCRPAIYVLRPHASASLTATGNGGGGDGGQVMEAVMHGAGGMDLIDPLFQHVLAAAAKARGVPVVMDEVFAGLWRLGRQSACHLVCSNVPPPPPPRHGLAPCHPMQVRGGARQWPHVRAQAQASAGQACATACMAAAGWRHGMAVV